MSASNIHLGRSSHGKWKSESSRHVPFGYLQRTWTEVSRINYFSALAFDSTSKISQKYKRFSLPLKNHLSLALFDSAKFHDLDEDSMQETFPINVTRLMNEEQLWGCFYNFPQLYEDEYSPVVKVRNISDIAEVQDGVLTRDLVSVCLSYLKRTPILGDYVYIKLDLSSKLLSDIENLKHYKYIVYLDLSSNQISELTVLCYLPYVQYLDVSFNRLCSVLDYETPQWFLTEVNYRYNIVTKIRDLELFWSITVLDLAHNNIKCINGLETLRYLRRLDLSFNHIQRLENLNHLRLLWLDLSYNNISDFEFGDNVGLWTLLHLQYLNLNENNLTSMKVFSGCSRLRELHARNNRFCALLDLAVYMSKLRLITVLDLRSNPVCSVPGYNDVIVNSFPMLLTLDECDLDPVDQRLVKMNMSPDAVTFASRRLLRLLYIEQLSRARVSPYNPPADTTDVPIVVLVGYEAVGKGSLARRLTQELSSHIELAVQHTTAVYHFPNHYIQVSRKEFDGMLLAGQFLTYSEVDGESYGLSREQAFVRDAKVRVVAMDLIGALMLKLRGRQPYLILTTCLDKQALAKRQQDRKIARDLAHEENLNAESLIEISTLQVLLSGRIIINGILNEILQAIPEDKSRSEFLIESECSLFKGASSEISRKQKNENKLLSSTTSWMYQEKNNSQYGSSIYSLYNEPTPDETTSEAHRRMDLETERKSEKIDSRSLFFEENIDKYKSIENTQGISSTLKGSRKSSKSVAFTSPERTDFDAEESIPSGLMIEPPKSKESSGPATISAKIAWARGEQSLDSDLWFAFLAENGLIQTSEMISDTKCYDIYKRKSENDDPDLFHIPVQNYKEIPSETFTKYMKEDYDELHRSCPGLFWDTVTMDNPEKAFKKVKSIIKNIVNSQKCLKPLFDIDFSNIEKYPISQNKLSEICKQIAPQQLFY
ncbi:uncharacterized protein LOC126977353 [Leptidea sinapis]|uniref:uncharacterized protein LOC126977353 n=1 Tax=Leptidea sinapis TaxID=189913 RepID=UPI0021C3249D|nr:uncharacterized protein LOC126977353 [Leptidea sinapis]